MSGQEKPDGPVKSKLFTKDGKPLRILTTSLGIALLANMALMPGYSFAATGSPTNGASGPTLVEWSTEEVKQYFDAAVDWNLPMLAEANGSQDPNEQQSGNGGGATNAGGSGGTAAVHPSSGFGWDDLMLYHLLFNNGFAYSSSAWASSHPTYYSGGRTRYQPKSYSSETFQNKPVAGSSVRPRTKDSTGTITRRSTSSSPGGMGGKSSGFSSSSSSSTHSSGGFGG